MGKEKGEKSTSGTSGRRPGESRRGGGDGGDGVDLLQVYFFLNAFGKSDKFAKESLGTVMSVTFVAV